MYRRDLFALGGLGAIGAGTGFIGPETDPTYGGSITIKVRRGRLDDGKIGWTVLVPDWENAKGVGSFMLPVKWMPLNEWLKEIERLG